MLDFEINGRYLILSAIKKSSPFHLPIAYSLATGNAFSGSFLTPGLPFIFMLFLKNTKIQLDPFLLRQLVLEHRHEVIPLRMHNGVIDDSFQHDLVETIKILDNFVHCNDILFYYGFNNTGLL